MNPKHLISSLFAAALLTAPVAQAFAQVKDDHTAKHGGIFVETKALDFEIVAKPDVIQVYVNEHGKPVRLEGAKGKMTLLNGGEKTEVELTPAGDKLEAKGASRSPKAPRG